MMRSKGKSHNQFEFSYYTEVGLLEELRHDTSTRAALKTNLPTIPTAQPQKHSQGWIRD